MFHWLATMTNDESFGIILGSFRRCMSRRFNNLLSIRKLMFVLRCKYFLISEEIIQWMLWDWKNKFVCNDKQRQFHFIRRTFSRKIFIKYFFCCRMRAKIFLCIWDFVNSRVANWYVMINFRMDGNKTEYSECCQSNSLLRKQFCDTCTLTRVLLSNLLR